jgi:CheY-like chemotaxis protein
MSMVAAPPAQILLVEDSRADAELTIELLRGAKFANQVHVARDGQEALDFLRRQGTFADVPTPDLVLLDINLPRLNGHEVLEQVKSDPVLRLIPVIMLSTSRAEDDVRRAYEHHANCFVSKPLDLRSFTEVIHAIETFWLSIVQLPPNAGPS